MGGGSLLDARDTWHVLCQCPVGSAPTGVEFAEFVGFVFRILFVIVMISSDSSYDAIVIRMLLCCIVFRFRNT